MFSIDIWSKSHTWFESLRISPQFQSHGRREFFIALALCSVAVNPLGQRVEAVAVLDNTPSPSGVNQFAAPANPNDGNSHILSRGYAFKAGNLDYKIDSVSAYLYDVFSFPPNSVVPTVRLELRSFDGTTPGPLLESLLVSITNTSTSSLSTFSLPSWNLSANSSYWLGLNWTSPYNQGDSSIATSGLIAWSVATPSLPAMGPGFTDLGFKQFVIGPYYPSPGEWANISCNLQCNSLRVNASPNEVPAPLPIFGFATAYTYSRKLRKRLRGQTIPAVSTIE